MDNENVMVVPRDSLAELDGFYPYTDFNKAARDLKLGTHHIDHSKAEVSEHYIQIVSSCVMKLSSGEHLGFRRHKTKESAGEVDSRLHLTMGGHAIQQNLIEGDVTTSLRISLGKKLVDEFIVPFPRVIKAEPLGIIIDRSGNDPIEASRHVCFLFSVELEEVPVPASSPLFDVSVETVVITNLSDHDDYNPWSTIYTQI